MIAAGHRAAHQRAEGGRIFRDPLAVRILGPDAVAYDDEGLLARRPMRLFIAVRSRFAEDKLTAAVGRGVAQIVVLGAGLDTTAYRGILPGHVRVFEADHPATQSWKRQRLADTGIVVPDTVRFVPVDFERDALGAALIEAGYDAALPGFFLWLGVVPYLTEATIFATLGYVAGLAGGADIVFDYSNQAASLTGEARVAHEARASLVAAMGEPWVSALDTAALVTRLGEMGFLHIDDLDAACIAARYFPGRAPSASGHGGHVLHARTIKSPS